MKLYDKIEKTILGILFLLIILAGFMQVVLRYALSMPLAWTEELIIFCSVWSIYLGASAAANEDKHIKVGMIVDSLRGVPRICVDVFSKLLWLVCAVGLTITGYQSAYSVLLRNTKTLGGQFPYWIAMIAVPIGMALMSVRVVMIIKKTIRGEADKSDDKSEKGDSNL